MTVTVTAPPPAAPGPVATTGRPPSQGWWAVLIFAALSGLYGAVGTVLMLRYNLFDPDSPSRVANAGYAVYSRDPHLSAIGFVWNPLPSLAEIPLMPLSRWWPELKVNGLAGVVQSALFMAGSALWVRRICYDVALSTWWRWIAVGGYALNPVIVIYGGSGMSEAAELFAGMWCVCYLMRWIRSSMVTDLGWAAIALALGYLARYEILVAAFAAAGLVAALSWVRSPRESRGPAVAINVLVLLFPIVTAVAVWAVAGWVVSGDLFAQLSSRYGNSGQVAAVRGHGVHDAAGNASVQLLAARLFTVQPFTALAVAIALAVAMMRKRVEVLVPVVVFGSVLAFAFWAQHRGTLFPLFRYFLPAIPLVIVIVVVCTATPRWPSRVGTAALVLTVLVATPLTVKSMLNPDIGNQPLQFGLRSLIDPDRYPANEQWYRREMLDDRGAAEFLDRKKLPRGSVLVDTFSGWGIWLASDNPEQFVVTSDYDFTADLNRLWESGIRYVVVSKSDLTVPDAVTLRYPSLWDKGFDNATLVYSANGPTGTERRRIYRIEAPSTRHRSTQR